MGVGNSGQGNPADQWIIPDRIASPQTTGAGSGSAGIGTNHMDLAPVGAPVAVSIPFASSQAPIPVVQVDAGDSGVAAQAALYTGHEPYSGVALQGGGGPQVAGTVTTPPHPSAQGPGAGATS